MKRQFIYVRWNLFNNTPLDSSAALLNVTRSLNYRALILRQDVELIRGDYIVLSKAIHPKFIKDSIQGAEPLGVQGISKLLSINRNMVSFGDHDPYRIRKDGLYLGDTLWKLMIFGLKGFRSMLTATLASLKDRKSLLSTEIIVKWMKRKILTITSCLSSPAKILCARGCEYRR